MSSEWAGDVIRHLRCRLGKAFHPNLKEREQLNNLQRGVVFSQSFGISYGSHYGMNSAIKQQFVFSLCLQNHSCPFFCLHFRSFLRVLCCLLLVVKRHVMTSLKQTIVSFLPYSFFVVRPLPLVDIFASYSAGVCIVYAFTSCHRFNLPFVS